MILEHLRFRDRMSLLAFDSLEGEERAATERHAASCERCRRELADLRALREALLADPVRTAEPGLPLPAMVARVQGRIEEALARRPAAWARPLGMSLAVAAALALAFVAPRFLSRNDPIRPEAAEAPVVSAEALSRLERNVAREQTARYLNEAGDVLVAMAAAPTDCDRPNERVDVGQASARSRELLARRALLLDSAPQAVASVGPVLDDVELALREVASLESCVRRKDVERLQQDVERRQLLMRIRLMTRELEG
jgi:putative zinc finger protein